MATPDLDALTAADVRSSLAAIQHHAFGADDGQDDNERRAHLFAVLFELRTLEGLLGLDKPRGTLVEIPLAGGAE